MSERSVTIGRDAQGNAIVTGSNNLTFVFFGMEQVPADLVEALQSGRLRPAEALGAVPLPALTLGIAFADDAVQWRITARRATGDPVMRRGPTPWQADAAFAPLLDVFARLARTPAETAEDAARLQATADRLGELGVHFSGHGGRGTLREWRRQASSWNFPSAPARDILWSKLPFRLDDG
jgi:hypothetical protein